MGKKEEVVVNKKKSTTTVSMVSEILERGKMLAATKGLTFSQFVEVLIRKEIGEL